MGALALKKAAKILHGHVEGKNDHGGAAELPGGENLVGFFFPGFSPPLFRRRAEVAIVKLEERNGGGAPC